MTREEFEVYPFEPGKFYIILVDPRNVDISAFATAVDMRAEDVDIILIAAIPAPGQPLKESMVTITLDSIRAVEEWVRGMRSR